MKLTNNHNLPRTLVDVIKKLNYDISASDPTRVSITTLINAPRVRLLTVKHWKELEEDMSDHIWRIMGNACHYIFSMIEHPDDTTRLVEKKLTKEIDGITIVGKLDLYDANIKSIEDWKITSVWSVQNGDHDDWERQLNCYAWLLRINGIEVEQANINALLRDWRKAEIFRFDGYPKIPFKRVNVKLWSIEEQEKYVKERVAIYKSALGKSEKDIPVCSPTERWARAGKVAVYKNANKTATRLLETEEDAREWAKNNLKPTDKFSIQVRPSTDLKCQEYCQVNKFCSYYKEKYGDTNGNKKGQKKKI